uniref:CHK domain-containing protein n=1 Tax=Parastrongyloides trichosuri TaxID=131310 RepID=A0A0N4ZAM2_PARTI
MFAVKDYENECIENSNVSIGWIFDCLEKNCDSFKEIKRNSKVLKLDVKNISDGKGFASKVYKSTVHFDGDENKVYQFVTKIPELDSILKLFENDPDKEEMSDIFSTDYISRFHNQEWMFYIGALKEIIGLKVPSCYGGRESIPGKMDGCLLMTWLSSNSGNIPFYESFNIYQTKSVLKEVMKLQVFSLTDGKHWRTKFTNSYTSRVLKSFVKTINMGFELFKEYCPDEMLNEIKDDYETLVSNYVDIGIYVIKGITDINGKNSVLCHGDLWTNNIMFELDSEKRFTNNVEAIIDWQSIFTASIGSDIARFIVNGCSPEVRREIEVSYFPVYFKELKKKVMDKGEVFDMTFEEFVNAYDFCMIEQALHTIMMSGLNLAQIKINNDEDRYIWEARKFSLAYKSYFALKDAFKRVRKIKPEWLNN